MNSQVRLNFTASYAAQDAIAIALARSRQTGQHRRLGAWRGA